MQMMALTGTWAGLVLAAAGMTLGSGISRAAEPARGDAQVNKWRTVYEGPRVNTADLGRLHWVPEAKTCVLWAADLKTPSKLTQLEADKGTWTAINGAMPSESRPDLSGNYGHLRSPTSSVFLPGLKRLLVLQGPVYERKPVSNWLVNPTDGNWEAGPAVAMTERSADYNPAASGEGMAFVPVWGSAAYDASNKEAVFFGGGDVWGRVGEDKEKVRAGDWIYDEAAKRVRRLLPDDKSVTEARRWFPAHCGTWIFSELSKSWAPIAQPLGQQPGGRLVPAMAYDDVEQKIVLFGGDDDARVLGDTWIYDCKTRVWSEVKPKPSPPARAGSAMVYIPGQKAMLLAGGYSGGGKPLQDVWVYRTAASEWARLALDLPAAAPRCSACCNPVTDTVWLLSSPGAGAKDVLYSLKLELASAPNAHSEARVDPLEAWHCKSYYNRDQRTCFPNEWLTGEGTPEDEKAVRARIAAMPANTWKHFTQPCNAPARVWGIYTYDIQTHTGLAWGGGHFGYNGSEVSEYSLLTNRWCGMADPATFRPPWTYGSPGGPGSAGFHGWSYNNSHTRKSLGVDQLSRSLINLPGDVYDLKHHMFIGSIGPCPGSGTQSYQPAYVSTPHGLYAYDHIGGLQRANVSAGKWEMIAPKGGPPNHTEYNHMCYDSKRDRIMYFVPTKAGVWSFDFKTKGWAEEQPVGKAPPLVFGDSTYTTDMDAALMICPPGGGEREPEKMFFYRLDEKKWYTASYEGEAPFRHNCDGLSHSPTYDSELKVVVRLSHDSREGSILVYVMRLEPGSLVLKPID